MSGITTHADSEAARAKARHCAYYLALSQKNPKDWQLIETNYAQIKRAFDAMTDGETRIQFLESLHFFQLRRGYWADCVDWCNTCLEWARRENSHDVLARLYRYLGEAQIQTRQFERATAALETALRLARKHGDRAEASRSLVGLGQMYARQFCFDDTLRGADNPLSQPCTNDCVCGDS